MVHAGGCKKHNFWNTPVRPEKLYIRKPGIKSHRLVYAWVRSEEGGGGGWLRGGLTFWDTPSRIFLGHFYRVLKTPLDS